MSVFHDSLLSIVIPRNFVSLICFTISSPILTSNSAVTVFSLFSLLICRRYATVHRIWQKGRSVMAYIWPIYGLYMAYTRPIYGPYMAYIWPIHGL